MKLLTMCSTGSPDTARLPVSFIVSSHEMDENIRETTPQSIKKEILDLCKEIDPSSKALFVPVQPSPEVRFNYCLTDVPRYAQRFGGTAKFGWIIWESPGMFLEAEFHACWESPEGNLIDITPKPDNEKRVLFLADTQRTYQHQFVENKRKLLSDNPSTRLWLKIGEKRDEIRKRHFKNDEVDAKAAEAEFKLWLSSLSLCRPKVGRNDPCICGSGLKYKRCCGNR